MLYWKFPLFPGFLPSKGRLISKGHIGVFKSTKKPTNFESKKYWRQIDTLAYAYIVLELCRDSFRPCPL